MRSQSALNRFTADAKRISEGESSLTSLPAEELKARFLALRDLPEPKRTVPGFALAREAARRALGLRPFDVQLIGGLALLQGKLAEMRTGEGKTLTLVAPAALLALQGKGVHVVTANSYLARRDAELMRPVFEALGLSVAFIETSQTSAAKREAYAADVTYGVGFEFGFDYLRDNMVSDAGDKVQRPLSFAIVDEVDSVLIDEARTPLIISGSGDSQDAIVRALNLTARQLKSGVDYVVDPKERNATLTERGYDEAEASLAKQGIIAGQGELYAAHNLHIARRLHSAVRAHGVYRLDRDYVVSAGEVVLVDQGTGRKMPGRRLEDGLHEAIEAKEGLEIHAGSVTRATITYQSFFGLYERLAGLTGTALTEAEEFTEFYGLETVVVPTNRPVARILKEDLVYLGKSAKFVAVADEIVRRQASGQPVLAGCASVRDAEVLSRLLESKGVVHEVLTAKHLEREAHIIAQAGRPGAVTVATNMAGRGTDIILGGEKPSEGDFTDPAAYAHGKAQWESARAAVLAAGGLFVLGTERSGIRRVDNQLAGRSGRQGDPGEVQFFLSLEDELLRVFGQSRQLKVVAKLIDGAGGVLSGKTIAKLVTTAQRSLEGQGFEARRNVMKYDSSMSEQRKAVYALRDSLLADGVMEYCEAAVDAAVANWANVRLGVHDMPEQWDLPALKRELEADFNIQPGLVGWVHSEDLGRDEVVERIRAAVQARLAANPLDTAARRRLVLRVLTDLWTEHLTALDELRQAVSLKGATGQNPLFQFHNDAFALFKSFEEALCAEISRQLLSSALQEEREAKSADADEQARKAARVAVELEQRWVKRNEPCPCGSGKRFKHCHGKLR
ncbi:Protein export cytoplasm protein SecA ATPase RNA helicase [Variovorax sp. WDL1]|nr:Protein export cytoplasm protein SecA ATPase RNA helicase [Variovorax sp. WDL1]